MNNNRLVVNVLKDERFREMHGGYKYLVRHNGISAYTAFNTDTGLKEFLKRNKMKMVKNPQWENEYILNKTIEEKSFYKLSDIENIDNCITYINLSNGSLVTCYSEILEDKIINYRPNPNAKKVYNPLPLNAHIEYMRIYG